MPRIKTGLLPEIAIGLLYLNPIIKMLTNSEYTVLIILITLFVLIPYSLELHPAFWHLEFSIPEIVLNVQFLIMHSLVHVTELPATLSKRELSADIFGKMIP
jgi:hypothetical protein